MAIHHVVHIQVAAGEAAGFATAFKALQDVVRHEEGCEQYELFQSLDDPDKLVILERWTSQELLDRHQEAERTRYASLIEPLVGLWAPGVAPAIERFETK
jgi:quinol monooxygenase YgiN